MSIFSPLWCFLYFLFNGIYIFHGHAISFFFIRVIQFFFPLLSMPVHPVTHLPPTGLLPLLTCHIYSPHNTLPRFLFPAAFLVSSFIHLSCYYTTQSFSPILYFIIFRTVFITHPLIIFFLSVILSLFSHIISLFSCLCVSPKINTSLYIMFYVFAIANTFLFGCVICLFLPPSSICFQLYYVTFFSLFPC